MALPLKIEHRIGIQTPTEAIWPMVADIAGWPAWNPLYTKAEGKLVPRAIIETLGEANSIFSNGEIFEGPLVNLISKAQKRAIKAGFTLFGEAVRDRAEAGWRAQAGDATSGAA